MTLSASILKPLGLSDFPERPVSPLHCRNDRSPGFERRLTGPIVFEVSPLTINAPELRGSDSTLGPADRPRHWRKHVNNSTRRSLKSFAEYPNFASQESENQAVRSLIVHRIERLNRVQLQPGTVTRMNAAGRHQRKNQQKTRGKTEGREPGAAQAYAVFRSEPAFRKTAMAL